MTYYYQVRYSVSWCGSGMHQRFHAGQISAASACKNDGNNLERWADQRRMTWRVRPATGYEVFEAVSNTSIQPDCDDSFRQP